VHRQPSGDHFLLPAVHLYDGVLFPFSCFLKGFLEEYIGKWKQQLKGNDLTGFSYCWFGGMKED
jgi:hypothetical protein